MNRTLYFGEGLFETIRWKGENRKLLLHYRRLSSSAEFFGIPCPSYEEFINSLKTAVGGKKNIYVKFCLFYCGSSIFWEKPENYRIEVVVRDLPSPPKRVNLSFSPFKRHSSDPIPKHKTMNYLFNISVKREALKKGYYDAIILNEKEEITECSASNLILLIGDKLYTPSRESGLLRGTTLEAISNSSDIEEKRLRVEDLEKASAVFLVNSLIGVVSATEIEGSKKVEDREVLKHLRKALEKWEKPTSTDKQEL